MVEVQLPSQTNARHHSQQPPRARQGCPQALYRRPGDAFVCYPGNVILILIVQFAECASVFRSVLQQLLLVVADEPGDADACKDLLAQSRDYLTAVQLPSPSLFTPRHLISRAQVIIETQRRTAEKDRCTLLQLQCMAALRDSWQFQTVVRACRLPRPLPPAAPGAVHLLTSEINVTPFSAPAYYAEASGG